MFRLLALLVYLSVFVRLKLTFLLSTTLALLIELLYYLIGDLLIKHRDRASLSECPLYTLLCSFFIGEAPLEGRLIKVRLDFHSEGSG